MLLATFAPWSRYAIFLLAGLAAGIANALAGGGTFITFPTMLALGIDSLQANFSSSVGVVPSYIGGIHRNFGRMRDLLPTLRFLAPACVLGTLSGCALLFVGSSATFRTLVPWLIGSGTVLFASAPRLTKRFEHIEHTHPARRAVLWGGVFLASIYGGYFGAGLGILLLAVMALTMPEPIHELVAIRSVLSIFINAIAALIFVLHGHLVMAAVTCLLVGTLAGGFLGAQLVGKMSPTVIRWVVVAIGAITTIRLAL